LQAGITQENQCLSDSIGLAEVRDAVINRKHFITSYVAAELDLVLRDVTAPKISA
jgi:hypothetical protein